MSHRLNYFDHSGVQILWCDYSRLSEAEMIFLLNSASNMGKKSGSSLNILADFSETPMSKEFNEKLKEAGKSYSQSGVNVKVAVLGIDSTFKRVIVNTTMVITRIRNVKLFENKQDALGWLAA